MFVLIIVHDFEFREILVGFGSQGRLTNRAGEIDGITLGNLEAEAPVTNDLVITGLGIHHEKTPFVPVLGDEHHADVGVEERVALGAEV